MNSAPIGIFDSGVGGLSVWKEVRAMFPHENIVYFADSARCPYGPKPAEQITQYAKQITNFLLQQGCKLIIVACNTATAAAIDTLRAGYNIPFVGMEPAVKQAALNTKTRKIGILATKGTFGGRLFKATSQKYAQGIESIEQVGEGLVELAEKGLYASDEARQLLHKYIDPMMAADVDQIVLGCTHYPFFKPLIEEIVGANVSVIDPAPAVAHRVLDILSQNQQLESQTKLGDDIFYTSGESVVLQSFLQSITGNNNCDCRVAVLEK
ncbi:MAG: glutamate racemase [Salinivirgaceae bacterium]|nr:glutamate racemase [Salinivirgaceae bacterium]